MLRKIAYIEIDTHAEIAQDFIDLMDDSKEFSVDYYFSGKIKNQIQLNNESVYLSDSSMILDQLSAKKYDLVIIGTVHRYFNTFLTVTRKYKTAVIIHNLNFSKISRLSLIKNVFRDDLIYRLKLLWKEGLSDVKKTYSTSKYHLVLDKELSTGKNRFLPLFYTKSLSKTENKHLTVVIPGGVSQKRRDYQHVFKTIQNMHTSHELTFVLLGKIKGQELTHAEHLLKVLPENISIKYFKERVSPEIFNDWMKKADVLWCPIQQETEFFSNKEIYGKTKMTGNLGDAVKFGKPAVFPPDYSSDLDFIIPEEDNVIGQFLRLKNFQYDFQKDFNREKIQKDAEMLLNQLISI